MWRPAQCEADLLIGRVGMAVPYLCRKALTSRRQQKVANSRCSSVLQTCAQARILQLVQCKADLLMREGRNGSAIPMCEGTNIKTPAEGLQTQHIAVRVKPVHSCAYSSAQDVPVCSKLGRRSAQSRSTHEAG